MGREREGDESDKPQRKAERWLGPGLGQPAGWERGWISHVCSRAEEDLSRSESERCDLAWHCLAWAAVFATATQALHL